jgi:hypothetical protein
MREMILDGRINMTRVIRRTPVFSKTICRMLKLTGT